jgi:hypothetical protein
MSNSNSVIKYNKLKVDNIIFTKFEDNPRVKSQKIGYIRYKSSDDSDEIQLKLQSPEIDTETYGIPREGPYYPDPKSRSFFKFPFCHERKLHDVDYSAIEQFYNLLIEIDNKCNTDEFRKQMFGEKSANQYAYQPIIRIPEENEDDEIKLDNNGQPYYRPPFTKIKFDLEYCADPENATNKPTIALFEKKDNKRTKIALNSFEDLLDNIKYRSKVRFIISFSKLYAMKTKSGTEKKKYGIILKAICCEIQYKNVSSKLEYREDAFVDSESDDETNNKNVITRNMGNLDLKEDSSEEKEQVTTEETNDEIEELTNSFKSNKPFDIDEEAEEEEVEVEVEVEEVIKEVIKNKTRSKKNK